MNKNRRSFLKELGLGAGGAGLFLARPNVLLGAALVRQTLPRATPESQGVSSAGISAFLDAVAGSQHEFHSLMIVRHGHVVAEGWWAPYAAEVNHMLYSLSKSFTSTAVGLAVTEGRLKVDDLVTSFFRSDLPATVSENLAALKVKHLLTMSVGHSRDTTGLVAAEENWVKAFLAQPIQNAPGSVFLYNSGATYMLSAIVQKLTGQKVVDYLRPRLFEPLDIEGVTWETCPRGINTGGWGLNIQTSGLAKFGQLYLQKGLWNKKQLLPAAWVAEATSFKIQQPAPANPKRPNDKNDWLQGYGYQFWRCQHKAFRGDGAVGQFMIVMPEQDAVVAITCETADMQTELDLVWEHLLPAMKPNALPVDKIAQGKLQQTLAALSLSPPKAQSASPLAVKIPIKPFVVEPNTLKVGSVAFNFQHNFCLFTLKDDRGEHPMRCGYEKWMDNESAMPGTPVKASSGGELKGQARYKVAASCTWRDANTLEMTWRFYETPHHDTVTCRFDGDQVKVEFVNSTTRVIANRKDKRPVLAGKIAA